MSNCTVKQNAPFVEIDLEDLVRSFFNMNWGKIVTENDAVDSEIDHLISISKEDNNDNEI